MIIFVSLAYITLYYIKKAKNIRTYMCEVINMYVAIRVYISGTYKYTSPEVCNLSA